MGAPSAAERADTDRSPGRGATTTPLTALLAYRRFSTPPVQRRPSPYVAGAIIVLPCRKMLSALGFSRDEVNWTVSAGSRAVPVTVKSAPPVALELSQPWPGAPLFAHGQGAPVPSPGQKVSKADAVPWSRQKTSW